MAKPAYLLVFAGKRGGWGVFAGIAPYVVDGVGVAGWYSGVFVRFCALFARLGESWGRKG